MPDGRVKLDKNGLIIATSGHVWSDPDQYIAFSSKAVNIGIFATGTVSIPTSTPKVDLSTEYPGLPSAFRTNYRKVQVPFGKTFASPPICLLLVSYPVTSPDLYDLPSSGFVGINVSPDWSRWEPIFIVQVTTTDLFLWIYNNTNTLIAHYIILENTLS